MGWKILNKLRNNRFTLWVTLLAFGVASSLTGVLTKSETLIWVGVGFITVNGSIIVLELFYND